MRRNKVIPICSVFLLWCVSQSLSQFLPQAQLPYLQSQSQAASLSKAPVGLYSRSSPFGDQESAASLSGAPVGLFSRRNSVPQFVNIPASYSLPFFYPYAFKPSVYRGPGFAPPSRPQPPRVPAARPPAQRPVRPPRLPPRPISPPKKPVIGPRSSLLGGLTGGLLPGLPILGR